MIWACKSIDVAEWDQVQDQFESLFMKLGCPGQMMLVATSGPGPTMLFASLPNPVLLTALVGFERTAESELPCEASLLVGHHRAFAKRFRYPRLKSVHQD